MTGLLFYFKKGLGLTKSSRESCSHSMTLRDHCRRRRLSFPCPNVFCLL